MSVAQTSATAYSMMKPNLGARQQLVYEAIEELANPSNEQISEHLNLPIQSVTGRVNELARYGFVAVVGLTKTRSGRPAKQWGVTDPMNDKKVKELDCEA